MLRMKGEYKFFLRIKYSVRCKGVVRCSEKLKDIVSWPDI